MGVATLQLHCQLRPSLMAEGGKSHPLLEELKGTWSAITYNSIKLFLITGLLARLSVATQPVKDGDNHLVPFCETLESIFRNGLKRKYHVVNVNTTYGVLCIEPNSWFGLNKQDYWSWIEPLQDYYYNQK